MTIEERHEALLDDIRELLDQSVTIAKANRLRITDDTPEDAYPRLRLRQAEGDINIYRTLLRSDWERQYDLHD